MVPCLKRLCSVNFETVGTVNPAHFFSSLEQGATLLTANQRLARYLRQEFDVYQQTLGRNVWVTPDILPLSTWLERCWNEILETNLANSLPGLLTPYQQQALWERIIAESAEGQHLLQVSTAAENALAAWALLKQWRITLESATSVFHSTANADNHAFAQWARRFGRLCKKNAWLDSATLPDAVIQHIKSGTLPLPTHMGFAGFDEFTPQQQYLLQSLSLAGAHVTQIAAPENLNVSLVRCGCADGRAEIIAAARWARHLLERDASLTIAVVIPELSAVRETVVRTFDQVFSPASDLPGTSHVTTPYNISLGTALLDEPVIHTAFLILESAQGKLTIEKMGSLLRSPFLAGAEQEMTRRALLDARLRRASDTHVTLDMLRYYATHNNATGAENAYACPVLANHLIKWAEAIRPLSVMVKEQHVPSKWMAFFTRLLACAGWPGERSLDSREYQAHMAWRGLLADYALLDAAAGKQTLGEAVGHLRHMAAVTLFQPQSAETPIQIMGLLETAGLQFDHMWIMGLHDGAWPEPARPNPFLPLTLQRQHNLPHASAARELAFAQQITQRLFSSAKHVIVSYPQQEADRELHPSPLIRPLQEVDLQDLVMDNAPFYAQLIHQRARQSARLEIFKDDMAPPLEIGTVVAGGTDVLKQQAACPFRAFARHRLGAQPLNPVGIGLNASERGKLLHAAMEAVWKTVQSHAILCGISEEELQSIIRDAVARVVNKMAHNRQFTFSEKFTALERTRLEKLITAWMLLEKQRSPFTVFQTEQERLIEIGGLAFTARIDRIDELPDGRHVIIDYKTGDAKLQSWFGERPDEPQLPLYGISDTHAVAGLAFAQLRAGNLCFKGFSDTEGIIPNVKEFSSVKNAPTVTWSDQFNDWRQVLQHLAEGFRAGYAPVDPKKPGATCQYCELTALCRIHEHDGLGLTPEAQEDDDD